MNILRQGKKKMFKAGVNQNFLYTPSAWTRRYFCKLLVYFQLPVFLARKIEFSKRCVQFL